MDKASSREIVENTSYGADLQNQKMRDKTQQSVL